MNSIEKINHWSDTVVIIMKRPEHRLACAYFMTQAENDKTVIIRKRDAMQAGIMIGYALALGDLMSGDVNMKEMQKIQE